jgi:hypothetical protein
MFIDELRTIREEISLKTIDMTTEQLNAYYKKGANEMMKRIEDIRKKNGGKLSQPADVIQ